MNSIKTQTSTQIRTFYSDSMSYIGMKFYNNNLSLSFVPFKGKDQSGRSSFDESQAIWTTINLDSAFALYEAGRQIIQQNPKYSVMQLFIPCKDASLVLDRKNNNGEYETFLTITKGNQTIPFKFSTRTVNVTAPDGNKINMVIESGLGGFVKTIEGYLTGINSDRHLNKLTEDYVKMVNERKVGQGVYPSQGGPRTGKNIQNKGMWKPKPYGANTPDSQPMYSANNQWDNKQQNFSDYQLPN